MANKPHALEQPTVPTEQAPETAAAPAAPTKRIRPSRARPKTPVFHKEAGEGPQGTYELGEADHEGTVDLVNPPANPAQPMTLHLDASKLDPELVKALLAAGAVTTAPIGSPAAQAMPTLPPPLPKGVPAFALRKLLIRNRATGMERMFCCLPVVPPDEWRYNPDTEEIINGDPAGSGELLNYDEKTRDTILRHFNSHYDPLRMNDDANAPASNFG